MSPPLSGLGALCGAVLLVLPLLVTCTAEDGCDGFRWLIPGVLRIVSVTMPNILGLLFRYIGLSFEPLIEELRYLSGCIVAVALDNEPYLFVTPFERTSLWRHSEIGGENVRLTSC